MANPTRTRASNTTRTTKSKSASTRNAGNTEIVSGYAGEFLKAVRARPLAAAAIAASAAGAGAFLWAKRAVIGEQAESAGEKLADLRDRASDQAITLRDKISERILSSEDSDNRIPVSPERSQSDIAAEALSLKELEPLAAEQSQVGAIAY